MAKKVAEIKTKPTEFSVDDFIESLAGEQQREDSRTIIKMMEKATKMKPQMWGASMIGFGNVRYKSPNTAGKWIGLKSVSRRANQTCRCI